VNGPVALTVHQYRYDQRQFWREPASVFFTIVMPLLFMVLFTSIFGNEDITVNGQKISGSTYYVPSILTLEIVSATFLNLVIWITLQRERGQLKRVRATPVPAGVVIGGRALTSFAIAVIAVVLLCAVGVVFYGVDLPGQTLPAFVVSVFVGVLSLAAVGFAFSGFVPSENAAPAMANFVALPIYFISGIFVPADSTPEWMDKVASFFPVKPLFDALLTSFNPATQGAGFEWGKLAVVAAWGIGCLFIAMRTFRWTPRG
jgi:ABC-2 type transport system permease protein